MEWPITDRNEARGVAEDIWQVINRWGTVVWDKTQTVEQTLNAIEEGSLPDQPPYWEEQAAMYLIARGLDSASNFLKRLPKLAPEQKTRAEDILRRSLEGSATPQKRPSTIIGI